MNSWNMNIWKRRAVSALLTVTAVVMAYAAGYQWAMATFEDEAVSYVQAVQVVVESITTAGFGGHAPWSSDVMNLYVLAMNLTGVLLVFLAVPVFLIPLFREVIKTHPPSRVTKSGHIVVCGFTPRSEAFVAELTARGRDYVIIEPDREVATRLYDAGYSVIVGDPESTQTLRNASIETAAGIVADAEDDTNASIALSVRELHASVRMVTLVEDPALKEYHQLAGADAVLSPRQLLGRSLARQVPTVMKTTIDEGVEISGHIELVELKVEPESEIAGQRIGEARLRERFGIGVIGTWTEGQFTSPATPDVHLEAGTRLLVAGRPDRIQALQNEAATAVRHLPRRTVVVAGYGRAGEAVVDTLAQAAVRVVVLDREAKPPVDVVGDVRDPAVLREAGVEDATAAIVTVDDDTTAVLATLVMRELNPELYIIVRANREEDEQKLYRAGANYVQSLATVSGRMMASTILEDEEIYTYEAQIEIAKLPVGALASHTLSGAAVRTRTGATVLAIVRDGETITELDPDAFTIAAGDDVIVAGTNESVRRFESTFRV